MSVLRLGVLQTGAVLGDVTANATRLAAARAGTDADLVLTPELSLTGYDVRDRAGELALDLDTPLAQPLDALAGGRPIVVGLPERARDGRVYNTAALLGGGTVQHRHRKVYLPTYGMFDEARHFARGDRARCFDHASGLRIGLLVCEDFWHPALAYVLAAQGMDLLLVQAAPPGRGVWEGGEDGSDFATTAAWERIARTTAHLYGVYVALCTRVGVEGPMTFAGRSVVAGPDGSVLARADGEAEALLEVEVDPAALTGVRYPAAHLRDEDLALTIRELSRILDDGAT